MELLCDIVGGEKTKDDVWCSAEVGSLLMFGELVRESVGSIYAQVVGYVSVASVAPRHVRRWTDSG